ncbi:MAG: beta-galactosidase, partial [Pseudomonadota bacterium]
AEASPSHWLDFYRYSSAQIRAFNRAQTEAIRAHSDAPISHNYMGRETTFDHFDVAQDMEIATWDSYPLGFLEDRGEGDDAHKSTYARQGDPDFQAFHHDLYRAVGRGRFWIMEQQPGPVNWAPWNPAPLPGMVRLWAWEAFAHGAEAVCYFRWRQAPFAQEQMHAGLLRADGAAAPGLAEAAQVAQEIADAPAAVPEPSVALVFDYEACWAAAIQPQGQDFDQFSLVFAVYRALRSLGLAVDILSPDDAPKPRHKLVVAPGTLWWRPGQREAYERSGAHVLVGPRAGAKTRDHAIPDGLGPDWPSLGVQVTRVESLRPGLTHPLEQGGHLERWSEDLDGAAEVVERRVDGQPALTRSDRLWYLAGWPDPGALIRLVSRVATEAGLDLIPMPP